MIVKQFRKKLKQKEKHYFQQFFYVYSEVTFQFEYLFLADKAIFISLEHTHLFSGALLFFVDIEL